VKSRDAVRNLAEFQPIDPERRKRQLRARPPGYRTKTLKSQIDQDAKNLVMKFSGHSVGETVDAGLRYSQQAVDVLTQALTPTVRKLIRSGQIQSNIFDEQQAQQLAFRIIRYGVQKTS
jgi:hypothetical protein